MSWPDAFALVGCTAAFALMLIGIARSDTLGTQSPPPPPRRIPFYTDRNSRWMWKSTTTTTKRIPRKRKQK